MYPFFLFCVTCSLENKATGKKTDRQITMQHRHTAAVRPNEQDKVKDNVSFDLFTKD
jgi:hypothetical protein